jgi:hypothetical protein
MAQTKRLWSVLTLLVRIDVAMLLVITATVLVISAGR